MLLVFTVSFLLLALETALVRVLSITGWQFSAHLAIAVAMLGMGVAGVVLTLKPSLCARPRLWAALIAPAAAGALLLVVRYPVEPFRVVLFPAEVGWLALECLLLAIPFFLGAMVIGGALSRAGEKSFRVYAADLGGASLGSLSQLALFLFLPLALQGALLERTSQFKGIRQSLEHPGARVVASFADLDGHYVLVRDPNDHSTPGMGINYTGDLPPGTLLFQDGFALGRIYDLPDRARTATRSARQGLAFTEHLPGSLALELVREVPHARVALLGLRSGWNLLAAAHYGIRQPLVVADTRAFERALGAIAAKPKTSEYQTLLAGASVIHSGVSRYLFSETGPFDLIMALHTDSALFPNSGASSLSAAPDLALETIVEMMGKLSSRGVLAVTGYRRNPDPENTRLLHTLLAAARAREPSGTADASPSPILIVRDPFSVAYLYRAEGWSTDGIQRWKPWAVRRGFELRGEMGHEQGNPITMDNPFLGHHFQWSHLKGFWDAVSGGRFSEFLPTADVPYTFVLLTWAALTAAAGVALFVPLVLSGGPAGERMALSRKSAALFAAYGMGYLFFEIGFIHKFAPYLDHVNTSFVVVLAAFLFFSGLGSLASPRIRLGTAIKGILVSAISLHLLFPTLFRHTAALPLAIRVSFAMLAVGPLAFFLGMPFPKTLGRVAREAGTSGRRRAAFGYAVNAFASVSGSVLAVLLVSRWGFGAATGAGVALYFSALLISLFSREEPVRGEAHRA